MHNSITIAKSLLIRLAVFPCLVSGVSFFTAIPIEAEEAQVVVDEVSDTRTTGESFSGCEVELKVEGNAVAHSLGIRATRVFSAFDDTGQDLLKETNNSSSFFDPSSENQYALEERISLKNPSRDADFIKSLEGELELFQPTVENGGMVVIEDFMSGPSEPITSNSLDRWGVKVTYLTKESYLAKKKELEDANRKGIKNAAERYGGYFAEMFDDLFEETLSGDKNSLQFFIRDPNNRVIDLGFQDNMGNAIKVWRRSSMGELRTYSFKKSLPPPDTKLVIYLATPEAIKVVPFKLENIPLP